MTDLNCKRINLLGHGYIELVEHWGSDQRIIEAARQSTNKGFIGWPEDEKLLKYLWTHKHSSPFEVAGVSVYVQAPIFVLREWVRHRTQSFNELSARYTKMPDAHYEPTIERCLVDNGSNKQANSIGSEKLTAYNAARWLADLDSLYTYSEQVYSNGLSMGVPKEIARLAVTVGRYTRMGATANLLNWLKFITLRDAPNAQYEIQVYASALKELLSDAFPRTMAIFESDRAKIY